MTKDETLNLALDALKTLMIERGSIYDKAIAAIKEALADTSPNFNCKSVQARLATAWGYVKAQPEHEPVAWYRDEDGIRIYYETKCWDDAIPLYTAPQPWEKFCDSNCVWTDHHPDCKLAQPEPVDEVRCPECGYLTKHTEHIGCLRNQLNAINAFEQRNFAIVNMDKFSQPAHREWVGLTKDEVMASWEEIRLGDWAPDFYAVIEAKLKERNT